jgi:hypothetical protein
VYLFITIKMRVLEIRSHSDVKAWLLEELELSPNEPVHVTMNGDSAWQVLSCFYCDFKSHEVFYNNVTNQYAFHVCESEGDLNFPNYGTYSSYDTMIHGVSERFLARYGCV